MTPNAGSPPQTRRKLLLWGWILLAASLLLCLAGPRLTESSIPADIGSRMGDPEWAGIGWIIVGMIVGALALMCFVAQWVLRPRNAEGAHQQERTQSK
jgi:hypothetical protein